MGKRSFRRNQSGQVIIVSGLLVAVLLLSTAVFVVDVQRNVPKADSHGSSVVDGYRQTAWNTMVSALANASGGGDTSILAQNLALLKATIAAYSYQAMVTVDCIASEAAPYMQGLWISSGSDGVGVSSVAVHFAFSSSNPMQSSSAQYDLNVTSSVNMSGGYTEENETKTVNLTVNVFNEDKPALAGNLSFSYQNNTEWVPANASIVDYGDGSYTAAFNASTGLENEPLAVMVECMDMRGITVEATLSASANAGAGGDVDMLAQGLTALRPAISLLTYQAMVIEDYSIPDSLSYTQEDLNVSATVDVIGSYVQENETKTVNLTVYVFNGDTPVLAANLSLSYQIGAEWIPADATIADNGDGSYTASFTAVTSLVNEPLAVLVQYLDTQGITVEATVTCNHI